MQVVCFDRCLIGTQGRDEGHDAQLSTRACTNNCICICIFVFVSLALRFSGLQVNCTVAGFSTPFDSLSLLATIWCLRQVQNNAHGTPYKSHLT